MITITITYNTIVLQVLHMMTNEFKYKSYMEIVLFFINKDKIFSKRLLLKIKYNYT